MSEMDAEQVNKFFFDYFRERITFVREYCTERIEGMILMCSYLDALAGYSYGRNGRNWPRFRKFIIEHSGVEDTWTLINLPELRYDLQDKSEVELAKFVYQLGSAEESRKRTHEEDLSYEEVLQRAPDDSILSQLREKEQLIRGHEYVAILWREYRCPAIHETRSAKDRAPDLWNNAEYPFYALERGSGTDIGTWRFSIPNAFILRTLEDCVRSFESYLSSSKLDIRELAQKRSI